MAIYHNSISNVSRANGSCSTATLSYITGEKVKDERLGEMFYGFGRQERIEATGTLLPEGAPTEWQDPKKLFNAIEEYEKSANARTAKKIEVALPRELTREQHIEIVESYIKQNLNDKGYGATYAIHSDPEENNPHAHILVPNRQINKDTHDFEKTKTRKEYALDDKGERIPVLDPETGEQKLDSRNRKQWKRVTVEQNPLDKKEYLEQLRSEWAKECNKYLVPEKQIDHRSNAERGIEAEPTIHEGYAAREIVQRGGISERVQLNEEIKERNSLLIKVKEMLASIADKLKELTTQKGDRQNERIRELMERRANSGRVRQATDGLRTSSRNDTRPRTDNITARAESAFAERKNRDAERERQRIAERERAEAEARKAEERARERASRAKSRGFDFER